MPASRLPKQALPFDPNDGRRVLVGQRAQHAGPQRRLRERPIRLSLREPHRQNFDSHLPVRGADGSRSVVDIRTLPIYRFQDNESHTEGLYSFSLTATDLLGYSGIPARTPLDGPPDDVRHPHILKDLTAWQMHYALHAELPTMWIENVTMDHAEYGVYRPWFDKHVYRNLRIAYSEEPFNRGMDDDGRQHGSITVDGLRWRAAAQPAMPVIQISDNNLSGSAESHFRNVRSGTRRASRPTFAPRPW